MSSRKVAVVTGSNKGIGFGIVKGLCQKYDGDVFLTSRDVSRGQQAVKALNEVGLKPKYHQLDITDEESIVKFRNFIKKAYGGIDLLVNNAGIIFPHYGEEVPFSIQAKETIKVNYFAQRKVCDLLFPLLRPHARVVNMSSSVGHLSLVTCWPLKDKLASPTLTEQELDDIMLDYVKTAEAKGGINNGWLLHPYHASKVGFSALSVIQQRKFLEDTARPDIIVNHIQPGYVDTDLTEHKGPWTIEQGSESPLYAALIPENAAEPKGQFIWSTKQVVDWVNGPLPGLH